MNKLSIIIPAYNEEENVKLLPMELVPYLKALQMPYEIIVVDDGSKDETVKNIKALFIPELLIVEHGRNRGIGAALRTGIMQASGELTVMLDSDMTFHPRYIKDLLERFKIGDVDFVIGSPKMAGYSEKIEWYRRLITKTTGFVYSLVLGRKITAPTGIFRLYKTADLKNLPLQSEKFDIFVEIIFRLVSAGKKYAEIPVPLGARQFGVSKLNYVQETIRHLKIVRQILVWRWQNYFRHD